MPATTKETLEAYRDDFELALTPEARDDQPERAALRRAAFERFAALGFPTTWHEEWRYTNLAPLAKAPLRRLEPGAGEIQIADLERYSVQPHAPRLVFVNGGFAPHLSQTDGLPQGMSMTNLVAGDGPAVDEHYARHAAFDEEALAALNTAFADDAAVVWIPRGQVLEQPLHILHLTVPAARLRVSHPRTLLMVGEQGQVRVVEQYVTLGDGEHFTNAVTELVAGAGAHIEHARVVREGPEAYHVNTTQIVQERDSRVNAHVITLGGQLVRNSVNARLGGAGADADVDGFYMPTDKQHVDNHLRVEHASPHCTSREMFRGILDDRARAVFTGRIVVAPGAQKTDAKQTNKSLLLSGRAQVDSKPQLEIYADDVKCTHGATIGQVDDDAVFYLRSRGMDEVAARSLLVYAFAKEGLNEIAIEPLRKQLDTLLLERLPDGEILKER